MNIGQAAASSGLSTKMIRYYETTGLIGPADRSAGGYRHFDEADVHALRFIRRSRDLGFSVGQIAELLALWRDRGRASAQVKTLALGHVAGLKRKIADLEAMARTLSTLAEHCGGDLRPECPIIDDLAADGDPPALPIRSMPPRFGDAAVQGRRPQRAGSLGRR